MELIVASNNKNKIREIKDILSPYFSRIISQSEAGIEIDVEEDGETFLQNAQKKSREIFALTGKATIADDSGLSVDALGGAPGVYSARYAGEEKSDKKNNDLLLQNLLGEKNRKARYICAISLTMPDREIAGFGEVEGEILHEPRGDGGFGYDPIVFIPELQKTFAQATAEEKNRVSHRYRALQDLLRRLK